MGTTQKNEFNISGKVSFVGMPQFVSDKFSYRTLVMVTWKDRFMSEVEFTFINDNMNLVNNIKEEDWVNVDFVLSGRKKIINAKARWFNTLEGISCVKQ